MTAKKEMFGNMVWYLAELKKRDSKEEWDFFWKKVIGMSNKDMEKYDLMR